MKAWLKKRLPLSLKLAIKRVLIPFRSEPPTSTFSFEAPRLSADGRVDWDQVNSFLSSAQPPRWTHHKVPNVSIVIPIFNKADFTFQCLRSLINEVDLNENKIIVINNASTDESEELLERFSSYLTAIHNNENLGFVEACNQAAASANGNFLVFLNNDTLVLPGWLDCLVSTIESDKRIGIVGSLFLYPDGTVQEAGSIVWKDGQAFHYGWGRSVEDPRFAFARDVDYCSGASLLIRRNLFERIGGFDRRYAPAYYEDADLCFSARSAGYRVVFQPASKLIHYEGATAGRDTNVGFKNYQITNQPKFYQKWKSVLRDEHYPYQSKNIWKAANRLPKESIVVFDDKVPTPDSDAGSARMFFILKLLRKHFRVTFIYKVRAPSTTYLESLWKEGIETFDLIEYKRLLTERKFKVAIVSRPELADSLIKLVKRQDRSIEIVFDMVDAHFIRLAMEYELTKDPELGKQAQHYRTIELSSVKASDTVWCNSSADREAVAREVPGKPISVIPTIHKQRSRGKSFADRKDLLFIGNFNHRPNRDAVTYIVEQVLPRVQQKLGDVKLHVIGKNGPSEFLNYVSRGVKLHGHVSDIEPLFSSCRVFVAPLRFGAGVKGKLGDALSFGIPIVTSSVGASGMGFQNECNAMIADSPEDVSDAVVRAYQDEGLWKRLSDNGYEHVLHHFSPEVVEEILVGSIMS